MKRYVVPAFAALLPLMILTLMATPPALSKDEGQTKLLRHLVLLNFKDDADEAQVKTIVEEFGRLPERISQIHAFEWGEEDSVENLNKGFTHCFLLTFKSQEDLEAYLPHQAHQDFVKLLRPSLEDVLVVDYWTND